MKDLILYKYKGQERLHLNSFYPLFSYLIKDFETIIRYQGCRTFKKQHLSELCGMCDTFLNLAAKKIYGLDILKFEQELAIEKYVQDHKNTFILMSTSSGKSLYFVLSAMLFDGLTIVVSSLIALMY
ncbi:7726_t:CDS:2 [Gigaspora margarita]|uniref:7726_t:CDS:1 n=1 Tax=Gigaspora margarita TaxID=4874 RepID=A0ABN7W8E6_GIGMA|nr:7726_t:CDS:2 [Gigaspora margarita]